MTTIIKDILVGRNSSGDKYYLTVKLEDKYRNAVTINHETISSYRTLSFSGVLVSKYGSLTYERGIGSLGQNYEHLLEITDPAKGFSRNDIKRIHELWRGHHLNDLNSHCAHQDRAIKWDTVAPCELTGYRAGSEWLVAELDTVIVEELFSILTHSNKVVA